MDTTIPDDWKIPVVKILGVSDDYEKFIDVPVVRVVDVERWLRERAERTSVSHWIVKRWNDETKEVFADGIPTADD